MVALSLAFIIFKVGFNARQSVLIVVVNRWDKRVGLYD
jgi:hypothetical protein